MYYDLEISCMIDDSINYDDVECPSMACLY